MGQKKEAALQAEVCRLQRRVSELEIDVNRMKAQAPPPKPLRPGRYRGTVKTAEVHVTARGRQLVKISIGEVGAFPDAVAYYNVSLSRPLSEYEKLQRRLSRSDSFTVEDVNPGDVSWLVGKRVEFLVRPDSTFHGGTVNRVTWVDVIERERC